MNKRIIYTTEDGSVAVITPSPKWEGTLEELAEKDVPTGVEWRIADVSALPQSRNYRNAWTDTNPTETVDVDLEKAKDCQRKLIIQKAYERAESNEFGEKDLSTVKAELAEIDFDAISDFDTLYNTFPASIDKRSGTRKYVIHKETV